MTHTAQSVKLLLSVAVAKWRQPNRDGNVLTPQGGAVPRVLSDLLCSLLKFEGISSDTLHIILTTRF